MSTLQALLNLGLVDIGSDDSRFAKMEAAGTAMAEKLKTEPALLIPATLIAIDSDADEDDPIFALVEELVIKEWKTLRNTHVNRPRELLRSILLHALSVVGEVGPEAAGIIWQTAISPLNHKQVRLGKESELCRKLLHSLGQQAEAEAVAQAHLDVTLPKKRRTATAAKESDVTMQPYVKLKQDDILTDVARAAGPHYPQGQALTEANPHWTNAHQNWSLEFSPRMSTALVKAVNTGMERIFGALGKSLQLYVSQLEQRLVNHLKNVETIQVDVLEAQRAGQMRLNVLWWSEARYSPSLMRGYRELPPEAAAVAMAQDLAHLVPALAPASVTYVLGETVAALLQLQGRPEPQPVQKLLDALRHAGPELQKLLPEITSNKARVPLFELTVEAVRGSQLSPAELRGRAGVEPNLKLTLSEFAMWTFRDIQARRLTKELE